MNWSANKGPTAAELEFSGSYGCNAATSEISKNNLLPGMVFFVIIAGSLAVPQKPAGKYIGVCILRFPISCPGCWIPSQDSDDGCQQLKIFLVNF